MPKGSTAFALSKYPFRRKQYALLPKVEYDFNTINSIVLA